MNSTECLTPWAWYAAARWSPYWCEHVLLLAEWTHLSVRVRVVVWRLMLTVGWRRDWTRA